MAEEDRTWPTGGLDPTGAKSRRARRAGTVTAWRTFRAAPMVRSAWVEVVPYATGEDAAVSLRQSPRYFTGAGGPDEEVVAAHLVEDLGLPGVYQTSGCTRRPSVVRTVPGTSGTWPGRWHGSCSSLRARASRANGRGRTW